MPFLSTLSQCIISGTHSHELGPNFTLASQTNCVQTKGVHHPLRITYEKLRHIYPNISPELALSCAVRGANDTQGPEVLVPTTLVFGIVPRVGDTPLTSSSERFKILHSVRLEMQHIMADLKIKRALAHNVPSAADRSYNPSDRVLVCLEQTTTPDRRSRKIVYWDGPFTVLSTD